MLLYPAAANLVHSRHAMGTNQAYGAAAREGDAGAPALLEEAHAFNERLRTLPDRWLLPDGMREEYYKALDVSGTGVIGTVSIPKIGVNLPIYHGNGDAVLAVAVGHMEGSSLPVGGEGTHAVISAHTGMASADLFTDLDKLKPGDSFLISVLDEQLVYEVSEVNTVLPDEMEYLAIEDGKDKVTLLTCTPQGVNSHRLLVTGVRKAGRGSAQKLARDAARYGMKQHALFAALGLMMMAAGVFGLWALAHPRNKKGGAFYET